MCPAKEAMFRGRAGIDVSCRQCKGAIETLDYILGQCRFTLKGRIGRNGEIVYYISSEVTKKDKVAEELQLTYTVVLLKADLAIKSQGWVLVVDVTVRQED